MKKNIWPKLRLANNKDCENITDLVYGILREYDLEPDPESTDADIKDIEYTYFRRGGTFFVLETESFTAQGSGEVLTNDLTQELKSVTNYGFGIDFFSSESLILSGSFVTDFTARVPETETNHSVSTWNIYHISGGTTFKIGNTDIVQSIE